MGKLSVPLLFLVLALAGLAFWAWKQSQVPQQGPLERAAGKVGAAVNNVVAGVLGNGGGPVGTFFGWNPKESAE